MLRVCLDARLVNGKAGGVQQFIMGLASGLSKLTDGDEEYLFLTYSDAEDWILPYIHGPNKLLRGQVLAAEQNPPQWRLLLKQMVPGLAYASRKLRPLRGSRAIRVPRSDGTIEKAGVNLMHFTKQDGFLTEVPSIYHPWDLQHLYLPQFFTRFDYLYREVGYRTLCNQARMVAVASQWGKRDLIRRYNIPEDKIQEIGIAPVLSAYPVPAAEDLATVHRKFSLPNAFVFYPAQTWPHKNHLGLLQALATLRQKHGLAVPLVLSGHQNEFFQKIAQRISELGLSSQVHFLGFVSPLELQCLYKLSRCMIFPSLFEGGGLPLLEAFFAGAPTGCSDVTCLPEMAGEAALIFNPTDPEEMAKIILRLWTDETLRRTLVKRGQKRVAQFSWDRTARLFRAHYRRLAHRPLHEEDRELLAAVAVI